MKTTAQKVAAATMSECAVVRIVGEAHQRLIRQIDNLAMDYGVHRLWQHNTTVYTAAGLRVLVDGLHAVNEHAAAMALQAEMERLVQADEQTYWWQREGAR